MLTPKHLTQAQIAGLIISTTNVLAPLMQVTVDRALDRCHRLPRSNAFPDGLNVKVHESRRTVEVQEAYWHLGRDESGKVLDKDLIVTNVKDPLFGWHFYGLAVDVISSTQGWHFGDSDHSDHDELEWINAVASIFKDEGLAWGGDWKHIKDYPHFQWGKCAPTPVEAPKIYLAAMDSGLTHEESLQHVWDAVGAA